MVNGNLPDGWEWKKIAEIADTTSGGTPLRSHSEYYGGKIPWAKSGELRDGIIREVEETITEAGLKNSSAKLFPRDTVVVALYGATVGRTGILGIDAASNQAVCGIFPRNNSFISKYMFYWLQSQRQYLISQSAGGAQPNISQGIIRSLDFPLAPLPEQECIVAKIEELFTQLEAGTAALERVQAGLKRYKASVLKAAVEGKLGIQNDEFRTQDDGQLPAGWKWVTLGEIGKVSGGLTKNSKRNALKEKLPYLRVANVYANELNLDEVSEIGVEENEIQRVLLQKGDLLVVEGNGSPDQVGRVALWNGSISPCLHQNHIIKVRFEPTEIAEYVLYWLLSQGGREQINSVSSSTSGLYTLSLSKVSNLKVPLPPLEEQRQIVAEVERRLSLAAGVESTLAASLSRAERLRQSILKSAFEGRLV